MASGSPQYHGVSSFKSKRTFIPMERNLTLDPGFSHSTRAPLVVLILGNLSFLVRTAPAAGRESKARLMCGCPWCRLLRWY